MANIIEEITNRMQEINNILASKKKIEDVSFDDVLAIAQFYHDYQNTNRIIDEIEEMARQDMGTLYNHAIKLKEKIDSFMEIDLRMWKTLDHHYIEQSHLTSYKTQWDAAKEKATKLWQQYQSESNRLDMMGYNDEEFKVLDAQCDQTKLSYDKAHKQNEEAYNIYRREQIKCGRIHFFEMQFLELLILKLSKLVDVILNDKALLGKEGTT